MATLYRRLKVLFRDFKLIIKVYFLLLKSKWLIEKKELKYIIQWIQADKKGTADLDKSLRLEVNKIRWYVNKLSSFVPFKSVCYDKSLALKKILNKKGIDCKLHYGASIKGELKGHTWLTIKGDPILGGGVLEEYQLVKTVD